MAKFNNTNVKKPNLVPLPVSKAEFLAGAPVAFPVESPEVDVDDGNAIVEEAPISLDDHRPVIAASGRIAPLSARTPSVAPRPAQRENPATRHAAVHDDDNDLVQLMVRIPRRMHDVIVRLAHDDRRSMSQVARRKLEIALAEEMAEETERR